MKHFPSPGYFMCSYFSTIHFNTSIVFEVVLKYYYIFHKKRKVYNSWFYHCSNITSVLYNCNSSKRQNIVLCFFSSTQCSANNLQQTFSTIYQLLPTFQFLCVIKPPIDLTIFDPTLGLPTSTITSSQIYAILNRIRGIF